VPVRVDPRTGRAEKLAPGRRIYWFTLGGAASAGRLVLGTNDQYLFAYRLPAGHLGGDHGRRKLQEPGTVNALAEFAPVSRSVREGGAGPLPPQRRRQSAAEGSAPWSVPWR